MTDKVERVKNVIALELRRPEMSGEPFSLTTMAENILAAIDEADKPSEAMIEAEIERTWAAFVNCQADRYFGNKSQREHELIVLRRFAAKLTAMRLSREVSE